MATTYMEGRVIVHDGVVPADVTGPAVAPSVLTTPIAVPVVPSVETTDTAVVMSVTPVIGAAIKPKATPRKKR